MTASFKPLNQQPVVKHALVPPPPRRPTQPLTPPSPMAGPVDEHAAASGHFPRQAAIPTIDSQQRISEEFYHSPPAYSAPPPSLYMAPPPPLRGTRARRQRARLLFLAVFIPAVLLLLLGLAV